MLRERLLELVEPLVIRLGYELVDVEYAATRSQATLRIFIDREAGIGVEDCERVSREVSALLDVEDPITVSYQLEVSSPGADRVLRTLAHYQRFVGERVLMELLAPRDGRKRYTGVLARADEDGIELNVDGKPVTARIGEIERTRLAPDWSRQQPQGRKR
jgi:ribosome maturation factor RimP